MPTSNDPRSDAAEASEALRGLAHATRTLSDPADIYPVLGDLQATLRSLRQVLDQLATPHLAHRASAYDADGDRSLGARSALTAADQLHQAGALLDQVSTRLDQACLHSGRIAWHPGVPERRWISVVFLQGEEAGRVLDILDRDGPNAAIEHLAGWDYGEETTQAAMENGYVYDTPPTGALDRTATKDEYTLTYSPFLGNISLLREHEILPDPVPLGIGPPPLTPPHGLGHDEPRALSQPVRTIAEGTDWVARRPAIASASEQGLSL